MTGQTINANGIHLSGDMQDEAGFPADWDPASIALTKEGSTNIYSVIIDIPAHRKYEYKFVNGNLFYEVEFVPEESRVGYDFNDNRWIYIDSIANDTFSVGPLLFAGNAPAGKELIHFKVDLKNAGTVDAAGVHLASSLNGWSYGTTRLFSFINNVYEYHGYATTGETVTYKFVNGNTMSNAETVPAACATSGKRSITASATTVLDSICFASCTTCSTGNTGINVIEQSVRFSLYPNPAKGFVKIQMTETNPIQSIEVYDLTGKQVMLVNDLDSTETTLNTTALSNGLYYIQLQSANTMGIQKLIIEQ